MSNLKQEINNLVETAINEAVDKQTSTASHTIDKEQTYTIEGFCRTHNISKVTFYRLRKQNRAPETFYVGSRPYISCEEAAKWREKMQKQKTPFQLSE